MLNPALWSLRLATNKEEYANERALRRLRLVRKWPRRARLPVRYGVPIVVGHFDLRQALSVDDLVLLDHAVLGENKGRDRVDFVGLQRALLFEGHAAVDVIP